MKGKYVNTQTITAGELIYKADIQFTEMVEYGVSMGAISSGAIPIPLEGARFDQVFVGELKGPKLVGKISGMDHLYVRADGLFQLHLHARVITEDGVNISLSSQGVSQQIEGEEIAQLRAAVSLFSSSDSYKWLNHLQLCALGTMDPINYKAFVSAYAV
jgi:hypothetical protein